MNHPWLLEAALRSLLMGATIFAVLKILRIRQVRAQRTAWVLALLAAVVMPALVHWPVGPELLKSHAVSVLTSQVSRRIQVSETGHVSEAWIPRPIALRQTRSSLPVPHAEYAMSSYPQPFLISFAAARPGSAHRMSLWIANAIAAIVPYAAALYGCIAFLLLVRLMTGVALTLRLRNEAMPAPWYYGAPYHGAGRTSDDIRISARIHTPVTIASSIVLPESSAEWDAGKLRMVLAHERAHVQQADFYVHVLAGVHCAIFWFSPFSWWLQRRLSALGEAMSDLAALEQAESRSSYAEVLLEFATAVRQPMAAVSMARSSNLRPRIERLLNDRLFHDAFSSKRRHLFLAAGVVPVALLASASLVRVHAAVQTSAANAPAVARAVAPALAAAEAAGGAMKADGIAEQAAPAASNSAGGGSSTGVGSGAGVGTSRGNGSGAADGDPMAVSQSKIDATLAAAIDSDVKSSIDAAHLDATHLDAEFLRTLAARADMAAHLETAVKNSYAYGDWDGGAFALVSGDDASTYSFSGDWNKMGRFDAIRRETKGDFIYYEHGGKSYVIQDPALLAKAKALYAPMKELGKQQEVLGRQQEALGKQQEELGRKQETVKVKTPDLTRELASLDKAMQELKALQSNKEVTQEGLADLQGEIGEIQGRLGDLQGITGDEMGRFGDQMGVLGAEQGKLGAEQGRIGAQQGKIAEEAQRAMRPLLDQAIKDGRAKLVE